MILIGSAKDKIRLEEQGVFEVSCAATADKWANSYQHISEGMRKKAVVK